MAFAMVFMDMNFLPCPLSVNDIVPCTTCSLNEWVSVVYNMCDRNALS